MYVCMYVHAPDTRGRAREGAVHDFLVHTQRLEYLRAVVALQGRNPNLGHHLAHAVVKGVLDALGELGVGVVHAQLALVARLEQRVVAHVWTHSVRAHPEEQRVVMHLVRGARLDHK